MKDGNDKVRTTLSLLIQFLSFFAVGEIAPIGYILGIAFSLIGSMLVLVITEPLQLAGSIVLLLTGLFILVLRIRKDIADIRED